MQETKAFDDQVTRKLQRDIHPYLKHTKQTSVKTLKTILNKNKI